MRSLIRLGVILTIVLGLTTAAFAALSTTPVFPQQVVVSYAQFLQGTDTAGTYKTVYTPTSDNGAKCFALGLTTTDTTATHLVTIQIQKSAVDYGGMSITTELGSGFVDGLPPQNLLTTTLWPSLSSDSDGNHWFFVGKNDLVRATFATALTAGKVINLQLTCVEF